MSTDHNREGIPQGWIGRKERVPLGTEAQERLQRVLQQAIGDRDDISHLTTRLVAHQCFDGFAEALEPLIMHFGELFAESLQLPVTALENLERELFTSQTGTNHLRELHPAAYEKVVHGAWHNAWQVFSDELTALQEAGKAAPTKRQVELLKHHMKTIFLEDAKEAWNEAAGLQKLIHHGISPF